MAETYQTVDQYAEAYKEAIEKALDGVELASLTGSQVDLKIPVDFGPDYYEAYILIKGTGHPPDPPPS